MTWISNGVESGVKLFAGKIAVWGSIWLCDYALRTPTKCNRRDSNFRSWTPGRQNFLLNGLPSSLHWGRHILLENLPVIYTSVFKFSSLFLLTCVNFVMSDEKFCLFNSSRGQVISSWPLTLTLISGSRQTSEKHSIRQFHVYLYIPMFSLKVDKENIQNIIDGSR